jgi:gliding motility-associated-like protein
VFNIPGTWDVTLVATGSGGTGSLIKQFLITTYPRPVIDFITTKRFLTLPNALFKMQNNSNSVFNSWDVFDSTGAIIQSSKLRDAIFNITSAGLFDVRLIGTNSYGCADTLFNPSYIGTIGQGYVYLPNAFAPNSIAQNKLFMPSLYNVMERDYTFRVFNRWGEMVYETHDLNGQWDGKFNGTICEQDVYIYTVNGSYYNEEQFSFRGTVTLLR